MKRLILILVSLCLIYASGSYAYNSAAHIYIAERVFQSQNLDLYYGSIAPDIALYADWSKWPSSFEDTHYRYIDLRPYAIGSTQKAFALGWLTHNEVFGADYYAHILNPIGNNTCATDGYYQGYVIEKACLLASQTGIDPEFAHLAIETAIDLLLRNNNDKRLGEKLFTANLLRSYSDWNLLLRVFVWKEKRTDFSTLAKAELTFRDLVNRYAMALSLPDPYNKKALAQLGKQIALEMFGIVLTEEEAMTILESALSLCEGDYKQAVDRTIYWVKRSLN